MKMASWLRRHRWVVALTALALVVRLVWVHAVHPPEETLWSDMAAYIGRAERLVAEPFGRFADEAFFPFGTHYLLALPLALFGPGSYGACATWWAILSAACVPFAYQLGGRLSGGADWPDMDPGDDRLATANLVARLSAGFVAIYYPLIAYAGYFLSETPFALCLVASAWFALRLADRGRWADAWWLGIAAAVGATVRPQILIGVALMVLVLLWRRRHFPSLPLGRLSAVLSPIALVVVFSLGHSLHHSGRVSVLAQNGALNRAFGRCHAVQIRGIGGGFGPPAFGQLHAAEQADPGAWPRLDPVLGPTIVVRSPLWDEAALNALADRCVEETSLARQIQGAATHVILLGGYNVAWPDSNIEPYRRYMRGWNLALLVVFAPAALLAMAMGVSRRWPRHGLVAAHLWGLLAVAMLVMGSARLRVPYDVLTIVLAFDVYGRLVRWRA